MYEPFKNKMYEKTIYNFYFALRHVRQIEQCFTSIFDIQHSVFEIPFPFFLLSFPFASAQVNPDSCLVAYYPFNGNANDESGNGNNGTVNGAILSADRFGVANNAYSFDGVNDFFSENICTFVSEGTYF
ncbi:MAG: hypothetical protein COS14_10790 [Bacteroidetes bacterium CG02_land_8_20_14_3_00_31_25]|nr:hypothetical protein [Bacteroidota bacterium]PIV58211.1 MAG: hypothetical protein COS14_10790 [Bacteroidetes bacterium CG02_land_8_20_14_3_00_31_25]PIX36529.1 MAG: hypothetical protein COZ59_00605 [Bacteroidetes bacterium CG_4_8_14_3_um_filter_31_14]